ncbi:MAG: hypothetical protein ACREPX_13525, partial [Rhodanobacteraceae bacterium]
MSIHARDRNAIPAAGFAAMRLFKWIGIVLLVLLLVAGMFLYWMMQTESGARFALARAIGAMDGKL